MNDRRYPWLVVIPKHPAVELHDLPEEDLLVLARQSSDVSRALALAFDAYKVNVASLGNVVRQLHVHHVVRAPHDPAWPAPVFGHSTAEPYERTELVLRQAALATTDLPRWFRLV
jgi:diadenosine tetraphosphate (Ap4A) HIT family hydrolase